MISIRQLGIIRTLSVVCIFIGVILGASAVFTYRQLDVVVAETRDASTRLVPQLERAASIELNVTRVSLQLRHAMLVGTPAALRDTLADVGEKRKLIDAALEGYSANVKSARGKELFAVTMDKVATFWRHGETNIGLITAGKKEEAFDHLVKTVIPARNELLESIATLRKYQQGLLADLVGHAQGEARLAQMEFSGVIGLSLLILGLTGWAIGRAIKQRVSEATEIASDIAAGNLSQSVAVNGADEFRPMLEQLGIMQGQLRNLVEQIRESSESIVTASSQIASGNHDLSGRTEQTASSLQQAVALMNDITEAVQKSVGGAGEANRMASEAAKVATDGGAAVSEVVSTMSQISDSSAKISEIIGVIDGIAFQTNILALNAAVEAARAGEQGRGFAVVAAEVRQLAMRSGDAANEIKKLIGVSVDRVDQGARLVDSAGNTMHEIVRSVQSVAQSIDIVTTTAASQQAQIQQVNTAMTQLEEATHQNAALVEQSTAASQSLNEQANKLASLVNVFRIHPRGAMA